MEGKQTFDLLPSKGATPERNKKKGQKKEVLEATGISGFTEALPGNEDSFGFGFGKDGSRWLTDQDGVSGDSVIGGLADGMASLAAFKSTDPFVQSVVYNTSKYAMLEVAQLVFDGLSGAGSGNASGLAIAQLKEMVKNVLKKLDTILDEPSKSCGDFLDKAMQAIEHKCPKDAKGYLEKVVENAVKGFNYATGKGTPVAMVSIMRLMIFAETMLATFDEAEGLFLDYKNPKVNQKRVSAIISDNLEKLTSGIKSLKNKEWFKRRKTFEANNQNALDQLLRQLLPKLVQLKSPYISKDTSTTESSFQMVISTRFLPQGIEDAALVSKKDVSVAFWKEENLMQICFGGQVCDHPITKENLESVIRVDTNTLKVTIDGQNKECQSITPALTESVLQQIIQNKNKQMFSHVADYINTKILGKRLLRTACEFGPASCVDFILEKSQINVGDKLGADPPLSHAAGNGHDDIVRLLVEKYHADVNQGTGNNDCALSFAILFNHISTVKTLVQLGARNQKRGYVSVGPAALSTVTARYVGDSGDREEILRYLTHSGIKTKFY